jgi:hypothetical protein
MAPHKRFDRRFALSLSTQDKDLIAALARKGNQSEGEVIRRLVRAEAQRVDLLSTVHGREVLRDMPALGG